MKWFTKHPTEVGMTYLGHCCFALGVGSRMMLSGAACVVHAAFPFLFERTASKTVKGLYATFQGHSDGFEGGEGI
jgi:hypothetical protein